MKFPKMIPALADLTQDIAGPLPVELLREWVSGTADMDKAAALLRPFEIDGVVVASDTSGLSVMTRQRDLLDVLALISRPKEILFGLGSAVGGRAIGTWVADNTEMHYPPDIPVPLVLGAMIEAQARIDAEASVRIGLSMHAGRFYEIGGGLYGGDAETVEYLAERFASAGEILLTDVVAAAVADDPSTRLARRAELDIIHPAGVFTLVSGARLGDLPAHDGVYPHGFTEDVFRALHQLRSGDACDVRARVYGSLLHERVVVFVTRDRTLTAGTAITDLLDTLASDAVMETILRQLPEAMHHMASLGGGIAILCFEDAEQALQVSYAIRDGCVEMGLPVKIGIDSGPILLLAKQHGPSGISGDAVNIASKISEDFGVDNMVTVTDRAARTMRDIEGGVPFRVTTSQVEISGIRL